MNPSCQQVGASSTSPSIFGLLQAQANYRPGAAAVLAAGRSPLSFHRLLRHAETVTKTLNALGIGRNDRIAIAVPNGPEMVCAFLTISTAASFAPLNFALRASEFDFYLSDLNAKALIVQPGMKSAAMASAQKHSIPIIELIPGTEADAGLFSLKGQRQPSVYHDGFAQADDVALILYTSGTTSRPKIVPLTHSNLLASSANIAASLQLSADDRCLNIMPLFHIHGLVGAVLSSMFAGSSVACTSGFATEGFFAWLGEFRPTWYTAVPTMHDAILSCARGNGKTPRHGLLRFIRSSSAPLPLQVMQELEAVFQAPVIEAYGMTEAAHQVASNPLPPGERKAGSVGLAAGPEVAVMDEQGNLVSSGVTGEIVIRGANVMSGYANVPEANKECFAGGWFRTGDQGYLDGDGYLFITGRLKEIINRGGEKISPREVDEVLMEHPAVSQAVTFSVPHVTLGEDVAAAVVLREKTSVTEEEIRRFAAMRLAEFKIPRQLLIVDEIPVSATGKLQRLGLAEKLGFTKADGSEYARVIVAPRDGLESRLVRLWEKILRVRSVGVQDNFFVLGGDSISAVRLVAQVEKELKRSVPLAALFQGPTIEKMAELLRHGGKGLEWNWLVPLQSRGAKPPFFLLHGSGELGRQIGIDQPVYGLRPHGLDGRRVSSSVEQMAADYIGEIRMVQAEGPYFVGGYSSGGLLAFEVAQLLTMQGHEVALLMLLDPANPNHVQPSSDGSSSSSEVGLPEFGAKVSTHLRSLWSLESHEKTAYVGKAVKWRLEKLKSRVKMLACRAFLSTGRQVPVGLRPFYFLEMNHQAARNYVARVYPGSTILLPTKNKLENGAAGWRRLVTGELEVYEMPGEHRDLMHGPLVKVWAERVRACLQKAQSKYLQ